MERLPLELLVRLLGLLPPCDLVQARQVSRGWRAAVNALEAHDRGYRFLCGLNDMEGLVASHAPTMVLNHWDHIDTGGVFPCTCGALSDVIYPNSMGEFTWGPQGRRNIAAWRLNGGFAQYGHRHTAALPPATWESLARERALAARMLAVAERLWEGVHTYQYDHSHHGGLAPAWMPCWVWLPPDTVKPATDAEVGRLVEAVLQYCTGDGADGTLPHPIDAVLRDPEQARALYAPAEDAADRDDMDTPDATTDDQWREGWRLPFGGPEPDWLESLSYEENLRGWAVWEFEVRKAAAKWRAGCRRGANDDDDDEHDADAADEDPGNDMEGDDDDDDAGDDDDDNGDDGDDNGDDGDDNGDDGDEHDMEYLFSDVKVNGVPWSKLTQARKAAVMDGAVATLDRIRAEVDSLVRCSTVVRCDELHWMGGLSPSGCLVGVITVMVEGD